MTQPKIGTRFTHPDWPTGLTLKSIHPLGHLVLETPAGQEVVSHQDEKLKPVAPKTPAEVEVEKILNRFFPDVASRGFEAQGHDHLDFPEVFVETLHMAVAHAFAAGRDFEGRRRDKRAERDERQDRPGEAR